MVVRRPSLSVDAMSSWMNERKVVSETRVAEPGGRAGTVLVLVGAGERSAVTLTPASTAGSITDGATGVARSPRARPSVKARKIATVRPVRAAMPETWGKVTNPTTA